MFGHACPFIHQTSKNESTVTFRTLCFCFCHEFQFATLTSALKSLRNIQQNVQLNQELCALTFGIITFYDNYKKKG